MPAFAQTTSEDRILLPTNGDTSDTFGNAVAITENLAVIGAHKQGPGANQPGAVYIFDTITGLQLRILHANDQADADDFGYSVDVFETTAIVGSRADDDDGLNSGSAYIMDITIGDVIHKLTASNASSRDLFGTAVAISETRAVVGAPDEGTNGFLSGMAYVFDTATGLELFELTPSDIASSDNFGRAVAISGNIAVVTSNGLHENNASVGAAYVFDMTTGLELFKLTANDAAPGDDMGRYSVSISGNFAIIGAHGDDDNGSKSGSAYIFDVTTGLQVHKLLPTDGAADDNFGWSVAISGNLAIVGAAHDNDNGTNSGSAYVFDVTTGQQIIKLLASNGLAQDTLGRAVAIADNITVLGAPNADPNGSFSGTAYAYNIKVKDDCPADLTGDGVLNFFDVSAFLTAFGDGDAAADFTGDGVFNFFDVSAFLTAFAAGCP